MLTVEAVRGRNGFFTRLLLRSAFFIYRDRRRPSVVVWNGVGEELRLFDVDSWDEAVQKRDRLRRELDELGVEAWADRYAVPATFVNPDDPWRGR